jgi:hypothetical protein
MLSPQEFSKMKRSTLAFSIAGALLLPALNQLSAQQLSGTQIKDPSDNDYLTFQTGGPWSPRVNLQADAVMVYGIGPRLAGNLDSWREHGYKVDLMTGVAWGGYQDYLNGKFDGVDHWDQSQTDSDGKPILHGGNASIPYISPGESYGKYLSEGVKRALDAGVNAIFLEEPEFWARSGWEPNLHHEWEAYYHEPWQPPNQSPDAQYRASKLKYYLYRRALAQVFDSVSSYGKEHGRRIPCYVATHSLINYADWRIVSPESSLINVGADGYIAQVWTGTARTPNLYEGVRKERTFESAFLEYGAMQNLVRASGRLVWYLNDPIEDDPNHDWNDYRTNWESTLTASLLQPEVWHYEIMPWPDRVFSSKHPAKTLASAKSVQQLEQAPVGTGIGGFASHPDEMKVGIPQSYETELQAVIHALGQMKQPDVHWAIAGTRGVGVLVSDTMMFERADPHPSDPNLGSFFGLAMPLVKRGIPVEPVQIESSTAPGFLDRYKLLLLTYEGQKPPIAQFHQTLAEWVHKGGALLVVDNDEDPYNAVREWWNTAPLSYKTPRQDLFHTLGIPIDGEGLFHVGHGVVLSVRLSPAALTYQKDGGEQLRNLARRASQSVHLTWSETNAIVLRRGPYVVAAGLDESVPNAAPRTLHGHFVDLFDSDLPVLNEVTLSAGVRKLLFDLDSPHSTEPGVVAAACRIRRQDWSSRYLTLITDGVAGTHGALRIQFSSKPKSILFNGSAAPANQWSMKDGTLLLHFDNSVNALKIEIQF